MKKRFLLFTTLIFLVAFTFGLKISAEGSLSITHDVEVKYNKALDTLTIDGVEYKAVVECEEIVADDTLKVNGVTAFEKWTRDGKFTYEITDAVRYMLDMAHMARAIDVDGDAVIDELIISQKTAVKVTNIGKTADKLVVLKTLSGNSFATPKATEISIEVKKDDVLVVAELGGIYYAEKVEAVETYATKLNFNAGKVTLANVGEVKFDNLTISGVTPLSITTSALGKDNVLIYYVYDGEVIYGENLEAEYKFAILKEVEKTEGDELNETTMTYDIVYIATLIVDGKEEKVILPNTGTAIIDGYNELTAEEAYCEYSVGITADNRVDYRYTIVAGYETDKNGKTIITINKVFNEEDVLVDAGPIAYNATTGLYTVGGDYNKVVLNDASRIYYTYYKVATGDFQHLGYYTKETITDKSFYSELRGYAYLKSYDEGRTYTLLAAFVDGEIEGRLDAVITYEADGTLVLYAPENSIAVYNEDDDEIYYEYTFLDIETMQSETFVDTHRTIEDATETIAGCFYAWQPEDEQYVQITPSLDTFKLTTINGIFENNGYILEFGEAMCSLPEDIFIWGFACNEDGESSFNHYKTLTVNEFVELVDAIAEYNKTAEEEYTLDAILVRAEDFDIAGKYNIKGIILPDVFYTELFDDFGTLVTPSEEDSPSTPPEEDEPSTAKAELSMTGKTARPDTEIEIPLVISDNVGLAGLQLELSYDDALTLEAIEIGDALTSLEFTPPGSLTANPITLLLDGQESDNTNGTVFKLVFKVKADALEGTYNIKVKVKDAYDNNLNTVEVSNTSVEITVVNYIPGDINGDGEVGARDITMLRRYIAGGYDVTVVEPALDVNRDGEVSARDITMLRRYIAGGYGIELE